MLGRRQLGTETETKTETTSKQQHQDWVVPQREDSLPLVKLLQVFLPIVLHIFKPYTERVCV